jgi:hypothetical protein
MVRLRAIPKLLSFALATQGGRCERALNYLSELVPAPADESKQGDPEAMDPCTPPTDKTPPTFTLRLHRPLELCALPTPDGIDKPYPALACVPVAQKFSLALDLQFEQIWNLQALTLGDLSSTTSLAPLETLTLEFLTTQRRVLEQATLDSAEELTSSESTTIDKEAVNVARSSSHTQNWHVDGSGSLSIGIASIGANAGIQESTTNTSNSTINHIKETTTKSAHSLKTLHKVEVRGVTDTFVSNRMTRTFKNPYHDRTLSLNVFQLLKHFSVKTELDELRPVLLIDIANPLFNGRFVSMHVDFLRANLLDPSLIDDLPQAILGARPPLNLNAAKDAEAVATLALDYLFGYPGIFHAEHVVDPEQMMRDLGDPNDPATSFDGSGDGQSTDDGSTWFPRLGGMDEALKASFGKMFASLVIYHDMYVHRGQRPLPNDVQLATAIAGSLADWGTTDEQKARGVLDGTGFTEVFRRVTAFLDTVASILTPLVTAAGDQQKLLDAQEENEAVLERLLDHLDCNRNYYTMRLLAYLADATRNQAIVDFALAVLDASAMSPATLANVRAVFDFERTFVDGRRLLVPAQSALTERQVGGLAKTLDDQSGESFSLEKVPPAVVEVEVPADGIHLEVAEGVCVLKELPTAPTIEADVTIPRASIELESPP